jgi:osmotically-inducible protein OsmY
VATDPEVGSDGQIGCNTNENAFPEGVTEDTMTWLNGILSLGFAAVLVTAGMAQGAPAYPAVQSSAAAVPDDDAIESQIGNSLKADNVLAPRNLDVDVKRGVATLSGKVRTADEKARAGRLADVRGISRVNNEIEIDPKLDQSKLDAASDKTKAGVNKGVDASLGAADKAKEGVQKGVTKTEEGVGKAADKTASAISKTGEKLTDASITTNVKTSFAGEKLLQNSAIDVDTTNHVVTLKGTVPSDAAKARAGSIASGASGVTRVVNQIVVKAN